MKIWFHSLSELMILRYLFENKKINLSQSKKITQRSISEVRHALIHLEKLNFIEQSGNVYIMTPSMYHQVKSDINYTQDQSVTYLKSKNLILDYLDTRESINNETIREWCRCTKKQATIFARKMRDENILEMIGKSTATKYIKKWLINSWTAMIIKSFQYGTQIEKSIDLELLELFIMIEK